MAKDKIKLNNILEGESKFNKDKKEKKFGLIAEEIENKDLENPSANKSFSKSFTKEENDSANEEDSEEFDEEEFEEDIGDFIPKTQQIRLESKVDSLFPQKEGDEIEKNEDEDYTMAEEDNKRKDRGNAMEVPQARIMDKPNFLGKRGRRDSSINKHLGLMKIGFSKDRLGWGEDKKEKSAKQYENIDMGNLIKEINFNKEKKGIKGFTKFEGEDYEGYYDSSIKETPAESGKKEYEEKGSYESKEK